MSLINVIKAISTRSSGTAPALPNGDFEAADFNEDFEGGVFVDATAPTVVSRTATSATNIRVAYSEAVNASVAGHTFNNGGNLTPSAATAVSSNIVDYTVSGLANGQTITHTYAQQGTGVGTRDTAGNQLAAFATQAVTNSIPTTPVITSAYVDPIFPDWIEIFFSENLDPASTPDAIRFTPSGGRTVTQVDVAASEAQAPNQLSLLVDTAYGSGDTITISYLKPPTNPLQGTDGTDVESFSNQAVTNNIGGGGGDTTAPTVVSATAINATTIRVVFSEATTPTTAGWTFNNGGNLTPSAVTQINSSTWDFTVSGLANGQTITSTYSAAAGNTLDAAGNELASFTGSSVTNNIAPSGGDSLSFTAIPFSSTDLRRPDAGLEYWIYQNEVRVPEVGSAADQETGRYDRWEWRAFEQTQGVYDWTLFDQSINTAIDRNQTFSFAIMASCGGCSDFQVSINGGTNKTLPNYIITGGGAWLYGGVWYPNWNSSVYKNAWTAFHNALAAHIAATSYNGVNYADVINYIDLRGVGEYDEWHFYPMLDDAEINGYKPTVASYKQLIDVFTNAYANYRLVAMSDGFDNSGWSNTPDEVINYLITRTTNKGNVGWRRDNWGHNRPTWYENKFESNTSTFNGQDAQPLIMNRWQTAPIVGEPFQGESTVNGQTTPYQILIEDVGTAPAHVPYYHMSNLGNGNMEADGNTDRDTNLRLAHKMMGYRIKLNGGSLPSSITRGSAFTLSLIWENEGVAPPYIDWDVDIELRSGASVVWSTQSSMTLKYFLPGTQTVNDSLTVPVGVAAGTYNMHLIVRDPAGYRLNMPLFIEGVQGDGSYILKSSIVVS